MNVVQKVSNGYLLEVIADLIRVAWVRGEKAATMWEGLDLTLDEMAILQEYVKEYNRRVGLR